MYRAVTSNYFLFEGTLSLWFRTCFTIVEQKLVTMVTNTGYIALPCAVDMWHVVIAIWLESSNEPMICLTRLSLSPSLADSPVSGRLLSAIHRQPASVLHRCQQSATPPPARPETLLWLRKFLQKHKTVKLWDKNEQKKHKTVWWHLGSPAGSWVSQSVLLKWCSTNECSCYPIMHFSTSSSSSLL